RTLPTFSSQSCASCENRRIGPYFRYENDPYVEQAPQNPSNDFIGSAATLTEARPTINPALVNSVICWGRRHPRGFLSRSYHPQPVSPSKSFANPEMFVESARSA